MYASPRILTEEEKQLSQTAHDQGLILAYDIREADLTSRVFKVNAYLASVCEPELREWYFDPEDAENQEGDGKPEEEDFQCYLDDLVFYQYTGKSVPDSAQQAFKRIRGKSFWPPRFIWLKGHMYHTYDLPATDKNGTITGIRF